MGFLFSGCLLVYLKGSLKFGMECDGLLLDGVLG